VTPARLSLDVPIEAEPWPEPVRDIFVIPLGARGSFVFGLSPRRPFDEPYRDFVLQITKAIMRAQERRESAALRASAAEAERRGRDVLVDQLVEASHAKDEFLAMLGHELRNPLSPISLVLEMEKLRDAGGLSTEHLVIERQVRHMVRLVDDLLDVSRITRGKVELRKESFEIGGVIGKAVEMAASLIEQNQHVLSVALPVEPIVWWGDPTRLAQVVSNLLTNAARYTSPRGHIKLELVRYPDSFEVSVTDTGIGIAPELLSRIFEVFVQGPRPADRAQAGLGIGLALVKNLVELHGGSVTARSAGVGLGSTFVVRLPWSHPPVTADDAHPVDLEPPKRLHELGAARD
jgi:signal transduction histidine kinase